MRRQAEAVTVIASYKRMWDTQRSFGKHSANAMILRAWYRKFRARTDQRQTHLRVSKVQATYRGVMERRRLLEKHMKAARLQSYWRMKLIQKALAHIARVALDIQRVLRGYWYGRKPVREMHKAASRIQGVLRGAIVRMRLRKQLRSVVRAQALAREFLDRMGLRRKVRKGGGGSMVIGNSL